MSLSSLAHAPGNPDWIWKDGEFVPWDKALVHVNGVGHASVPAVFEGIKAYVSRDGARLSAFRLADHLARLFRSARVCRLDVPFDLGQVHDAALELLRINRYREDVYLRPWIFPEGVIREVMVPAGARCHLVIDSWPFRTSLAAERGCRAAVSSWTRPADASMPARVKAFANYHNGRLALIEARENGHDFPIMLNERRKISEAPSSCIGLLIDGQVVTPSSTSDVLQSLTAATVADLCAELGIGVVHREVDRTELYLADELFLMGTGVEVLPITAIDGRPVGDGRPGPVTLRIRQAYADLVRGVTATRHPGWLSSVPLESARVS
ncbi:MULTISPECIES: aminotransferase class IV [Catenuloplanes]|uniref:Branched-chain amino acid aminotransferase n=1 Tax=Catenuloplanes niger TaxID=587534 RepID=A0AAE4CXN5_9ACTN|nr:aminotransferase class IV [Catenuloplanes niger]MDR7326803.1 branched-chain amino acid aminotransferase [Catenuloplanes niger]